MGSKVIKIQADGNENVSEKIKKLLDAKIDLQKVEETYDETILHTDVKIDGVKSLFPQARKVKGKKIEHRTPVYEKLGFSVEEVLQIYFDHIYMTRAMVAEKYGFFDVFDNETKAMNAVMRIFEFVKRNPTKFLDYGVDERSIHAVSVVVSARKYKASPIMKGQYERTVSERVTVAPKIDGYLKEIEYLLASIIDILRKKLDDIRFNDKKIKNANLSQLVNTFDKLFDKLRILKGESTENVAMLVKTSGLENVPTEELIRKLNEKRMEVMMNK